MDTPLYRPSAERTTTALLTAFRARVESDVGLTCNNYARLHSWSVQHPEDFWRSVWKFTGVIGDGPGEVTLVDADRMPGARWFPQARLNFAANLLRHGDDRPAILFRDEAGTARTWTFRELAADVAALAAGLREIGVGASDRVAAWLPNIPETVVCMLAAASLGAGFASCSPDFGVPGVVDRFRQVSPKVLIGMESHSYGGRRFGDVERVADAARALGVEHLLLVGEPEREGPAPVGRWLREVVTRHRGAAPEHQHLPFAHPLYILFSSGTTGAPKAIVHSAGGTLLQHLKEHQLHCDIHEGDRVFYYTTCGWMMWNWLVSALASGAAIVLYDGSPFAGSPAALFDLIDELGITHFGVSAKYIEAVKKAGLEPGRTHRLDSLRTVFSTGSPLAPESFDWVYRHVKPELHLASISGGTDIVSCFVLGDPTGPVWRGEIQVAGLGMDVAVFDPSGKAVVGEKGELVCRRPFPAMPLGFLGDVGGARYRETYFERFPGVWHHGDFAEITSHGGFVIHGRSDAVLNPGGVRIGTAEIYRQVEQLDEIEESLAIGQELAGDQRIVLFVRLREGLALDERLVERVRRQLRENASPRHVPGKILQVTAIPRTKSGKISEIAVREVIHGRAVSNTEALANPEALEEYRDRPELRVT